MTWASFVSYVTMRELGQSDATNRNYELDNLNGSKPGVVLDRAFARMGFDQANTARPFVLPMIRSYLRNVGYMAGTDESLTRLVHEWYNWDRIRKADVSRWPMRKVENPLL